MDTQSIGPVGTQPAQSAAPQPAVRTTNAPAVKDATATKEATAERGQAETGADVRTRDPRSLQFQVDGATKQVVATIVDEDNKLVVRQIPDAEVLRIAQAIDRMKGFLLEGKA